MSPIYDELRQALTAYRAEWSDLPQVAVPTGPSLRVGARGPRIAALRQRLGLAAAGASGSRFDRPLADALRRFQAAHGLPATGIANAATVTALNAGPAHFERLIAANLERARAVPADPGRRHLLVDVAGAQLRLYEDGKLVDTMKVVVGKLDQQTPIMAGLIRFAMLNPYWNMPPDIIRGRVASNVISQGPSYLKQERLEILSDWTDRARVLDPAEVDWAAVASGRQRLRVRQLPGPKNVMGRVKFMLPNRLGIYLHDTPEKEAFRLSDRTLSSGCVRVEDAPRLARWLFGGQAPKPASAVEERVDLPTPVPVYITYLTAAPSAQGIAFQRDIYGRDPALLARLDAHGRQTATMDHAPGEPGSAPPATTRPARTSRGA
jgi:murein L,D-transpeptidase YcbB/YkuD